MGAGNVIFFPLAFLGLFLAAAPLPAVVTKIVDGDTIQTTAGRVRLKCVDAPETGQSPFGAQSSKNLASLLPVGSSVELRGKTSGGFGRIAAEVIQNGSNVNLEMVAKGQAFVYWNYLSGCNRAAYSAAELSAKSKQLGIWQIPNGIQRPWDFRR